MNENGTTVGYERATTLDNILIKNKIKLQISFLMVFLDKNCLIGKVYSIFWGKSRQIRNLEFWIPTKISVKLLKMNVKFKRKVLYLLAYNMPPCKMCT